MTTTNVSDGVQIGLYDGTNLADLPNTKSSVASTQVSCQLPLHTSPVLTLATATQVQIKGYRNGTSTLQFGYGGGGASISGAMRMTAVQLK